MSRFCTLLGVLVFCGAMFGCVSDSDEPTPEFHFDVAQRYSQVTLDDGAPYSSRCGGSYDSHLRTIDLTCNVSDSVVLTLTFAIGASNEATILSGSVENRGAVTASVASGSLKVYAFDSTVASVSLTLALLCLDSVGSSIRISGQLNNCLLEPLKSPGQIRYQGNKGSIHTKCTGAFSESGLTLHLHAFERTFVIYTSEINEVDLLIDDPSIGKFEVPDYRAIERYVTQDHKYGGGDSSTYFSDSQDILTITKYDTYRCRISGEFSIRGKTGTFSDVWFGFVE